MRRLQVICAALFLAPPTWSWGADTPQTPPVNPPGAISVWDTGHAADKAPAPPPLAGKDWTPLATGQTADSFRGDAAVGNGRVLAILRKHDPAVDVYSTHAGIASPRLRLRVVSRTGEPAARLVRVAVVENSKASACLEAGFETENGSAVTARFRIKRGDITVQAEPGTGAGKLRVECPGRFGVLPDFFADDITIDATRLPLDTVELPSENFILHLTGAGDAIAMCVFENRQQDVKVTLSGTGDRRILTGSEIGFEDKKIWVALLEAPKIWHIHDLRAADTGKLIPLDWTMPFPAQWRVDFTRSNDLTDSWEMLLQDQPEGKYTKPSWLGTGEGKIDPDRHRWNTVLGSFAYPCWSDPARRGYLQPIKSKVLQVRGPVVVYPINRVAQTPLDTYTVVDVMRNTLGVGPCQHILDVEGQKAEYKGRATCSVRDTLTPIYEKQEQKQKHAEVEAALADGLVFVKHIRGRIGHYVAFGKSMRQYLAAQKQAHGDLSEQIAELDKLTAELDDRVAGYADKMKTPEHVARMNDDFRKNVLDHDDADALKRCQAYARALVEIGGTQDELVGECRWVVKSLRQRAGIMIALDPRMAPIVNEIRARTQEALRNPATHEGARH